MRGVLFNGKVEVSDNIEVRDPRPNEVTVRLDPALVRRAKLAAVTRDTTLQALVEQGLRQQLRAAK